MNKLSDLGHVSVGDAMSENFLLLSPTSSVNQAAQDFESKKVDCGIVVDEFEKCIGIFTFRDVVHFESLNQSSNEVLGRGSSFEMLERDGKLEMVMHPFDEVQRHMSRAIQTIDKSQSLLFAIRVFADAKLRHLVVVDESIRPLGVLSPIDILLSLRQLLDDV